MGRNKVVKCKYSACCIIYVVLSTEKILRFFCLFTFERERERDMSGGGAERERETQNPKQTPGSELSAQSPM